MKLLASDPDIETIVARILRGDIDLQPDFQRGEVWSETKKKRLIDTILRDWHVPPIHVIEVKETSKHVVLDGQQRLAAIRDFVTGLLQIDGSIEPSDQGILSLDGLTFDELPKEWQRRFNQFTIRLFRVTEYKPQEPGELFFRLNQPTHLTSAEQRNAFFGPARQQVKDLVKKFDEYGLDKSFTGFSNSRMAYDDIVARLCFSIETQTLAEKITASGLANRYRSNEPFTVQTISRAKDAIQMLGLSIPFVEIDIRLTKATLYSWLWFIQQVKDALKPGLTPKILGSFIGIFEQVRTNIKRSDTLLSLDSKDELNLPHHAIDQLISIYNDRSSSRVSDVSSVLFRDLVIWITYLSYTPVNGAVIIVNHQEIQQLMQFIQEKVHDHIGFDELSFEKFCYRSGWGKLL